MMGSAVSSDLGTAVGFTVGVEVAVALAEPAPSGLVLAGQAQRARRQMSQLRDGCIGMEVSAYQRWMRATSGGDPADVDARGAAMTNGATRPSI